MSLVRHARSHGPYARAIIFALTAACVLWWGYPSHAYHSSSPLNHAVGHAVRWMIICVMAGGACNRIVGHLAV